MEQVCTLEKLHKLLNMLEKHWFPTEFEEKIDKHGNVISGYIVSRSQTAIFSFYIGSAKK